MKHKREQLERRHGRIRMRVRGTVDRPRLSVSRSSKHIRAQIIDDEKGRTLAEASDLKVAKKLSKDERAKLVGKSIAERALGKGIAKVVFDRGGFRYQGRIRTLAESARKEGLKF